MKVDKAKSRFGDKLVESDNNHHLEKFKNVHTGKTAILFATGSSLNDFDKGIFGENYNEFIKVGVNHIYNHEEITKELDYYFFGDFIDKLPMQQEAINNIIPDNTTKIITYENYSDELTFKNLTTIDVTFSVSFTKNISEYKVMSHSIVFPAISFLLYTGISKIYLVGCDCTKTTSVLSAKSSGHFYDNDATKVIDEHFVDFWKYIGQQTNKHYPNVKIVSVNPVGLKNIFDEVFYSLLT